MDGGGSESVRLLCPRLADGFVGREAVVILEPLARLSASRKSATWSWICRWPLILVASGASLMVPFIRSTRPLSRGGGLGDAMDSACPVKGMAAPPGRGAVAVLGKVGELYHVVGQDAVNLVVHR